MRESKWVRWLSFWVAGVLILGGCGVTQLNRYPDFPARKAALGPAVILGDILLMRQTLTDTPAVDLAENMKYGGILLDALRETLAIKSYEVSHTLLGSVGMNIDRTLAASVRGLPEGGTDTIDTVRNPPFFLYQPFSGDPAVGLLMASVYKKLTLMDATGEDSIVIPEMVPLGRVLGGGMVFVVLIAGYEVPAAYSHQAPEQTSGPVRSKIGVHDVSQSSMRLYVLDVATGEVIWSDNESRTGGTTYIEKYFMLLDVVTRDLP